MAITRLQSGSTSGSGTSKTITLGTCTPGSVIVVSVTAEGAGINGCSDPTNGAYTSARGSAGGVSEIFYKANTANTALTLTVAFAASATALVISVIELYSAAGTLELDAHAEIPFQADAVPNPNRSLTLTTTVANAAGFACAMVYPATYIANPDSGWTSIVNGALGVAEYHDSQYRLDLGAAGAKTIWAGQNEDYGGPLGWLGMSAVAFREPSALTKKWRVPVSANGLTAELQILSGSAGARSVIDQATGIVSASGYFKFALTNPGSFSVGDKRLAVAHDWNGSTSATSIHSFVGIAEVIQE